MNITRFFLCFVLFVAGQVYGQQTWTVTPPAPGGSWADAIQGVITNQAHDGDTVVINGPVTISWDKTVTCNKGITIMGGCPNANGGDCTNAVVVKDDIQRQKPHPGLLNVSGLTGAQAFRLTGFKFTVSFIPTVPANGNPSAGFMNFGGASSKVRIDHCLFDNIAAGYNVEFTGSTYGVVDHCKFNCSAARAIMSDVKNGGRNGVVGGGWPSWADNPRFGSASFMFFEDNECLNFGGGLGRSLPDSTEGGRYVFRHNNVYSANFAWHGTESNFFRGTRAVEIYQNNFFHPTGAGQPDGGVPGPYSVGNIRSGVLFFHDNSYHDAWVNNGDITLNAFRERWDGNAASYYFEGINNVKWDKVVTDHNAGTWTWGGGLNPPTPLPDHYYSGFAATVAQGQVDGSRTVKVFPNPNWTTSPKQWVTSNNTSPVFFLVNTTAGGHFGGHAPISDNTADTITTVAAGALQGNPCIFSPGDTFKIYKVFKLLDQPGLGKGDDFGTGNVPKTSEWPRQASEPCFSWRNKNDNGNAVKVSSGQNGTTVIDGEDFFNLTVAGAPCTTNDGCSTPTGTNTPGGTYTAALNGGSAYTGIFKYPHPCTVDFPLCSGTANPRINSGSGTTFTPGLTSDCTGGVNCFQVTTADFTPPVAFTATVTSAPTGQPNALPTHVNFGTPCAAGQFCGDAVGAVAGLYKVTIVASHAPSETATQTGFTLTVSSGNAKPTVTIASAGGTSFFDTDNVTITASPSDSDGTINHVEFFDGSTSLGTDSTSAYSFTGKFAAGDHVITAVATDNGTPPLDSDASASITLHVTHQVVGTSPTPGIIQIHP